MVRRWVAAAALLCGVVAGCRSRPLVGVVLPTTGDTSAYGESIESGIRLALSDARNRGDLPTGFEVAWADSGSDPERSVRELRALASEHGAHLVIGGATNAEALAIIPVLEELDVVCLSPSASASGLAGRSRLFFRIYPSDELEANTAASFLFDRLSAKRLVLYVGNKQYADGIEPEFRTQYEEALRGKVVARIDLDDPGWRTASEQMLGADREAGVYIIGYADEILGVLKHLSEVGYAGRVVTTASFYSTRVIRDAGALAEGVLFPLPPFDRTADKEPVVSFVNRYMDTFQRAPDVFAAHGYDAMRLAIEVMRIAHPPVATEIRRALQFGVTDFNGVTGPILFDDNGDVKHYPKMFIVKDGQVLSYQRYLNAERARILHEVQGLLTDED